MMGFSWKGAVAVMVRWKVVWSIMLLLRAIMADWSVFEFPFASDLIVNIMSGMLSYSSDSGNDTL